MEGRGLFFLLMIVAGVIGGFVSQGADVLNGNNVEDLRFPVNAIRLGGVAPATTVAYRGGEVLSFSTVNDNYVYLTAQLPHSWREGDDIVAHIHWTVPVSGAGAGAENVKWDLTYSWANMNEVLPVEDSETLTRNVATVVAGTHLYDAWVNLDGSGKTKSSMIILSIKRDTSVLNDYGSSAYLLEFDIHYRQDRLGSSGPLE